MKHEIFHVQGGSVHRGDDDHGDVRVSLGRRVPGEMERDANAALVVYGDGLQLTCEKKKKESKTYINMRGIKKERKRKDSHVYREKKKRIINTLDIQLNIYIYIFFINRDYSYLFLTI